LRYTPAGGMLWLGVWMSRAIRTIKKSGVDVRILTQPVTPALKVYL
jgi:hypothetical protein